MMYFIIVVGVFALAVVVLLVAEKIERRNDG